MANVLIIGANRGIGLELCRSYSDRGERVVATCRESSEALQRTGAHIIEGMDVTRTDSIRELGKQLRDTTVDILVHNAGILARETLDDMDYESIERQFQVNTLGPLKVVHGLLGWMRHGSRIAVISSRMGSIQDNGSGGRYGYRISKAGLNALSVSLAHDLKDRGIPVIILHPGLVATRMTGNSGIPASEAATGLVERIDALTPELSGTFWHAQGYQLPW